MRKLIPSFDQRLFLSRWVDGPRIRKTGFCAVIYILHSVDVIAAILREFQAPLGKRRKVIDAYEAPSDARLLWKRMACLRARLNHQWVMEGTGWGIWTDPWFRNSPPVVQCFHVGFHPLVSCIFVCPLDKAKDQGVQATFNRLEPKGQLATWASAIIFLIVWWHRDYLDLLITSTWAVWPAAA